MTANVPDMPRVWFISSDDNYLIQLQPDRFLLNWREGAKRSPYPRYKTISRRFKALFGKFEKFLKENELGTLALVQAELSYINHLRPDKGWSTFADIGEVFPDLAWRRGGRYLPAPTGISFRSNHKMDGGALQVAIQSARIAGEGTPLIRFDITARGAATEFESAGVWAWYDQANVWIVDAFVDMTSKRMQQDLWRRVK
jgi:uncharacterized protein (TIGR04255 family)